MNQGEILKLKSIVTSKKYSLKGGIKSRPQMTKDLVNIKREKLLNEKNRGNRLKKYTVSGPSGMI